MIADQGVVESVFLAQGLRSRHLQIDEPDEAHAGQLPQDGEPGTGDGPAADEKRRDGFG